MCSLFVFSSRARKRLFSQVDTGSITGTVTDPAGAVLTSVESYDHGGRNQPAARHLSPIMTAAIRLVRCGSVNTGSKPNCRGSNVSSARRYLLQVQQTPVVNLQMELGTVTQETTVTAAEELVRTVGRVTGRGDRGA